MSVREWAGALPSPLPASRIWSLPSGGWLEFGCVAVLSLLVAHRHGLWAAVATAAAAILSVELAARRPAWALGLLVVAYGAAPRIDAQLRVEDFITLGLVLAALRHRRRFETPLDTPIALWILAVGLSLAVALLSGTIARPATAALTVVKMVEYLVAFYAAYLLRTKLDLAFFTALVLLAILGLVDWAAGASRPFDRWPYKAESNQVAGIAVLCAALAYGRMNEGRTARGWLVLGLAVGVAALAQSRTALAALAVMSLFCLVPRDTRRSGLAVLAVLGGTLVGPLYHRTLTAPQEWKNFVRTENRVAEGYPPLHSHTRNRFETWGLLAEDFAKVPIVGTGPGSRDRVVYENAYVMLSCELGVVGVGAFFLLLLALFCSAGRTAAFATVGMMTLGLASISFFLSREAGPWWILVGSALGNRAAIRDAP